MKKCVVFSLTYYGTEPYDPVMDTNEILPPSPNK